MFIIVGGIFMLRRNKVNRIISFVLAVALVIGLCLIPERSVGAASQIPCNYNLTGNTANYNTSATPYQMHGKLSVSGTNLVDAGGNPVQLRGVSLHGIQHTNGSTTAFKDYVNLESFQILRDEWGVNLIRIPVYTEEGGYCRGGAAGMDATIQKAVDYATQLGMYIIIDWHILSDGNPWNHQGEAVNFFNNYSAKYSGYGNVLYEICNEPNGVDWGTIKSYAETVIPVIRSNDSNAIIIVGTPNWSQYLDDVSYNPIQGYSNIMYTLHFYAASQWHKDALRNRVTTAHNNGLPIFCTEFGICDETGNGNFDFDSAATWMNLLKQYNISYCCWSLCNKNEAASMFDSNCTKVNGWTNSDLATTGAWYINYTRPLYDEEMNKYTSSPNKVNYGNPGKNQAPPVVIDTPSVNEDGTFNMFRLYNPNSGEHFYTSNTDERDNLIKVGWRYEGVGWKAPATSNTPVYRLYNKNAGDHHYTMSIEERDNLVNIGWKYEGIGWYSDDAKSVPLYRQYNPNAKAGSHNYTTSKAENDKLVNLGWRGEGVGWYGVQ